MMKPLITTLLILGGIAMSVLTTVKAYGLTIESWPWLIFGTIAGVLLIAMGNEVGK